MNALQVFVGLFSSRKNQVALATFIVTILAAVGLRDFPVELIIAVIAAGVTLGATVINGIKAEDVARHTANGVVTAASLTATTPTPTVGIDANTVEVTAPDDRPVIGRMG